ncbi:MAG: nucleoside hydrolase [Clostridia bacterium]|nr:nucleoside hydrolase [Clostridia bacterium]
MDNIQRLKMLTRPAGNIDAVLDTDTYNEIDDQFALAYLLSYSEKINTKAIYAAPFFNGHSASPADGMEKSYAEILNLLTLLGQTERISSVFKGSCSYLENESTPVDSAAARHLAELAMEYSSERPLYVIAIGAITNIASALLLRPEIKDRIVIVWLGGHSRHWPNTKEFNMAQDVAAARVVFGSGVPMVQIPCNGVASSFTVSEAELRAWLMHKNKLCDYLVQHTVEEVTYAAGKPWTRVIWDVVAVAWVVGEFTMDEIIPAPIPEYDHHYGSGCDRHLIKSVYHVHRDKIFEDMVARLSSFN